MRRIWLANLAGNALLLALVYVWLGIPDQKAWQLMATVSLGAAILFGALGLFGWTLACVRGQPFRLRQLPALAVWLVALIAALWLAGWISGYFPKAANWMASALTLRLHRPVKPAGVLRFLSILGWIVTWIVVPAILLPAAGTGFRFSFRRTYWLQYVVLFAVGIYVPYRLVNWVPAFQGVWLQWLSLAARLGVAWLLLVTAWVLVLRQSSHCRTQP